MQQLYPTRPVVSNNALLLNSYNAHPDTAVLHSQCLTPDQVVKLLEQGAKFETIVCVDNDGQEVLEKMGFDGTWNAEFDTRIEHYNLVSSEETNIDILHQKVQGENFLFYGMG